MTNSEKFRPRSALVSGWILFGFEALYLLQSLFFASFSGTVAATAICTAAALTTFLCFIKPAVIISDEGIKIINPTKEIFASWDRVESIDTKYSMSITVDGRTIYAWAAPAPGRYHARSVHESELRGVIASDEVLIRPGDAPRSDSGSCAYLSRFRQKEFFASNRSALNIYTSEKSLITLWTALGFLIVGFILAIIA